MIYFAAPEGVPDVVKIGFTAGDPATRVTKLANPYDGRLRLVDFSEGTIQRETMLHTILSEHRIESEWFNVAPEEAIAVNHRLHQERMEKILALSSKQFAKLPLMLCTSTVKETFLKAMAADDFYDLIDMARRTAGGKRMGRPPTIGEDRGTRVQVMVEPEIAAAIDRAAASEGKTRSEIIRQWLAERAGEK